MTNGRHLKKIEKSPYLSNGLANLGEVWQDYVDRVCQEYLPLRI